MTHLASSPLERAVQTAQPLVARFRVPLVIDDRLVEAGNFFEGRRAGVGDGILRLLRYWRVLWNPFRPS